MQKLGFLVNNRITDVTRKQFETEYIVDELKEQDMVLGDEYYAIITDQAKVAWHCKNQNLACVVWLNENSKGQSFPNGAYCVENLEDITLDYLEKVYQRAHKLPWKILETKRLMLREITVEDVPRLYELYKDPEIYQYMENLFENVEEEIAYTKTYIEKVYEFYGYGMWIVTQKDSGEIIGRAGVEYKEGFDGLELGFMIGKQYQKQGYAFEICDAIVKYVREELEQEHICAYVKEDNLASISLCEKLGFHFEKKVQLQEMNEEEKIVLSEFLTYVI